MARGMSEHMLTSWSSFYNVRGCIKNYIIRKDTQVCLCIHLGILLIIHITYEHNICNQENW